MAVTLPMELGRFTENENQRGLAHLMNTGAGTKTFQKNELVLSSKNRS
jgi:hypothetical protein